MKRQKSVLQQKIAEFEQFSGGGRDDEEKKHREIIPIRIDLARTNAKLGKCFQSLGDPSRAEMHFRDYAAECERLHDEYSSPRLDQNDLVNRNSGGGGLQINQLKEQVYVDYDTSLAQLGHFYSESEKYDTAIDLNQTRLKLIDQTGLKTEKSREIKLQALFNLALLFAKKQKVSIFCVIFLTSLI